MSEVYEVDCCNNCVDVISHYASQEAAIESTDTEAVASELLQQNQRPPNVDRYDLT